MRLRPSRHARPLPGMWRGIGGGEMIGRGERRRYNRPRAEMKRRVFNFAAMRRVPFWLTLALAGYAGSLLLHFYYKPAFPLDGIDWIALTTPVLFGVMLVVVLVWALVRWLRGPT